VSLSRRALLSIVLFLTFWAVTFAFSAPQERLPISSSLDYESVETDFLPEPERTFLPASDSISSAELWTYVCELEEQRPGTMTNTCADFGEVVHSIEWSTWDKGSATGTGIYSINDCDPDCADGTRHEAAVNVELKDVTRDGNEYFLNTFTFTSKMKENLPKKNSAAGSWDVSEFYRMVPGMREGR